MQTKISVAQMTALETAGIFVPDEMDTEEVICVRAAIQGDRIEVSEEVGRALTEIANGADAWAERGGEDAKMYRADCRALSTLASNVFKASRM